MEFQLLGSVSVATGSGDLALGPAKRRSLLAALLLAPNSPVTVSRLIDTLWEDEPPAHARTVVQGHVSRLRALLTENAADEYGVTLETRGATYTLSMPESLLDAHRFEELTALAREQQAPADAVLMLREALALWRGSALTGTVSSEPLQSARHTLEESRLCAVEDLAGAYGRLGEHARAAAVLRPEAVANPLRESVAAALMRHLRDAGRQSDALDWYGRTRRLLADELGVDPGPLLQAAHAAVLAGTGPVQLPAQSSPAPREQYPLNRLAPQSPNLLPRIPAGFLGREAERSALDTAATGQSPVCPVTGPAGVGKTSFAVHWAHHRAHRFPDGILFADLQGFSEGSETLPLDILREFLLALGTPPHRVPGTLPAAAALFRAASTGRRMLVLLDNAKDSAHVRQLLPGGPDCVTVVTSRNRLEALISEECARPVTLDLLAPRDGVGLLHGSVGSRRIAAEPAAALRIAELCDGLPLALRITAARLATRPLLKLGELAEELADEHRRLELLSARETGVPAALGLSVAQLAPDAALLLHMLGLHPGPDIDRFAAAALAGLDLVRTGKALALLTDAHLVQEHSAERYSLHDLVRLYAARMPRPDADGGDSGDSGDSGDGLVRLADHYIRVACRAAGLAVSGDDWTTSLPVGCHASPGAPEFGGPVGARDWLASEQANLLAVSARMASTGHQDRSWRLVKLLAPLIIWRPHVRFVEHLWRARDAAEVAGEAEGLVLVRNLLAWVLNGSGESEAGRAEAAGMPELAHELGLPGAEAMGRIVLGMSYMNLGDFDEATASFERAIPASRASGQVATEMLAHNYLGVVALHRGEPARTVELCETGLGLSDARTARPWRALLLIVQSGALLALGRPRDAYDRLAQALRAADEESFLIGVEKALEQLVAVARQLGEEADADAYGARLAEARQAFPLLGRGPA